MHHEYDFMIYLDADEFLFLRHENHVGDFLREYVSFDQLGLNWLVFGTNDRETFTGTLLENFTKSDKLLDKHIKTFLNVRRIRINKNKMLYAHPHYYQLQDMSRSVTMDLTLLKKNEPYFHVSTKPINTVPAYVAHYSYQSYERYVARKLKRPRDDKNEFRLPISSDVLHTMSNDVVRTEVRDKYNRQNRESIRQYQPLNMDNNYTIIG
jgi:hypothetical protein